MSLAPAIPCSPADQQRLLRCARGAEPCDLVLKNARIINVFDTSITSGDVGICGDRIAGIGSYEGQREIDLGGAYLCPGFIEGHIHIESSMLSPARFAEVVVPRGTTTVVCDPHEIANVLGTAGIEYMLAAAQHTDLDLFAVIPSCVPATHMETSGATLSAEEISRLLDKDGIAGLGEMMNFPGTIYGDRDVLAKLHVACRRNMLIDGHAPGLRGPDLQAYCAAGISSDHECTDLDEAREKLAAGMYIFIREGSTAKNMEALLPLVTPATSRRFVLVTDDRHADDLLAEGHLDHILRRAVSLGLDPVTALQMVTINPAERFGLVQRGAIAPGYLADLVAVTDLTSFSVNLVCKHGKPINDPDHGNTRTNPVAVPPSSMHVDWDKVDFRLPARPDDNMIRVIGCVEHQIVTTAEQARAKVENGFLVADPERDLLKIAVIERHHASGNMGLGFVRGFGLKDGAIASTIAHDSHNLLVVGTDDRYMEQAARLVDRAGGGIAIVSPDGQQVLSLPLAGLMSDEQPESIAASVAEINAAAARAGIIIHNPFMLLSFLALPVIPALKITDQGLIDVASFSKVSLWI